MLLRAGYDRSRTGFQRDTGFASSMILLRNEGRQDFPSSDQVTGTDKGTTPSYELDDRQVVLSGTVCPGWRVLRQAVASKLALQRFPVNAEDFGGPTDIVMVRFQSAQDIVPLEIIQGHPAGNLSPA